MLANIGYAFAAGARRSRRSTARSATVGINFFVNPGKRVYVRHIVFKGNTRTAGRSVAPRDAPARRRLVFAGRDRPLQDPPAAPGLLQDRRRSIRRKVPGTDDQVDVIVTVEETSSGSFTFGLGYSQVQGLIASISVTQNNFLGTGDQVGVTAQQSCVPQALRVLVFRAVPDHRRHRPRLRRPPHRIRRRPGQPRELPDQQRRVRRVSGDSDHRGGHDQRAARRQQDRHRHRWSATPQEFINYINNLGHHTFHTWETTVLLGARHAQPYWNPTRGSLQQVQFDFALPGSTVEYYTLFYRYGQYLPITRNLTFYGHFTLGYGDTWRTPTSVLSPSDPNYISDLVGPAVLQELLRRRRLRRARLPRQHARPVHGLNRRPALRPTRHCRLPIGGAFKTVASAEIIFPTPFVKEDNDSTRLSWFVDVGNVFTNYNAWSASELRASTGISFQWRAPVGPIVINLAKPIRSQKGDDTETIQFSFGNTF